MRSALAVLINGLLLLSISSVSAQSLDSFSKTLFNSQNVVISSEVLDCIDNKNGTSVQYVNFQIINNNDKPVSVSFDKELWHNGICSTCSSVSQEHHVEIEIPADGIIAADCNGNNRSLRIFLRMIDLKNVRSLSNYELKNMNVEVID